MSSPTMATPSTPATAPSKKGTPASEPPASSAPSLPPSGELPTVPGTHTMNAVPQTSGLLMVYVPVDAKVTINGRPTLSVGSRRQFVSYGLKPGFAYKYEVHAELVRDGQLVEENQTVTLTAGQRSGVAFGFNTKSAEGLAAVN